MKKYMFLAVVAFMAASCTTITKTARTENVPYSMYNATVADLEVSPNRITYTLKPSKEIRKGGIGNVKQAALQEALTQNGNADLMLEPQYVISHKKGPLGIFINKVTSITVTGRPATYKNFRSLSDDVWTDPVFRGHKGTSFNIFKTTEK
ncbi:MAG: hypothetical protein J5671_00895 [Bacteroidaceae bacterium]|nr:hypothetical protein [Bacteroidaceae bacterium]